MDWPPVLLVAVFFLMLFKPFVEILRLVCVSLLNAGNDYFGCFGIREIVSWALHWHAIAYLEAGTRSCTCYRWTEANEFAGGPSPVRWAPCSTPGRVLSLSFNNKNNINAACICPLGHKSPQSWSSGVSSVSFGRLHHIRRACCDPYLNCLSHWACSEHTWYIAKGPPMTWMQWNQFMTENRQQLKHSPKAI